jgi:hypothetical protein
VIFGGILLVLDEELNLAQRALLAAVALVTPATVVTFLDLTIAERNVFFLLACFVLLIKRFDRSLTAPRAIAVLVCSQCLLYMKEPVFLLLLTFTATRLISRRWNLAAPGWTDAGSRLDLFVAALSLVYLTIYVVVMWHHSGADYLVAMHVSWLQAAIFYLRIDWLACLFSVVTIVRLYRVIRRQTVPSLVWDGLACGGVAYFAVFIALGLAQNYYTCPVDLIAVLYLGHLLFPAWPTMRREMRVAVVVLTVVIVGQALDLSSQDVLARKKITLGKVAIGRLILDRYLQDPASVRQLYFPFSDVYVLEEFLAYLNYLGLPLEQEPASAAPGKIEIFSARKSQTGKCLLWNFICHAGPAVSPSLVVVLPDDIVLPSDRPVYNQAIQKLQSYDPRVRAPHWLLTALSLLEVH